MFELNSLFLNIGIVGYDKFVGKKSILTLHIKLKGLFAFIDPGGNILRRKYFADLDIVHYQVTNLV